MRFSIPLAVIFLGLGAAPAFAGDGEQLYIDNCSACHLLTGRGVPGSFPALAGSKTVVGDPTESVTQVLKGRGGMPSFSTDLSDLEVAQVLTYVRTAWGNKGRPVAPALVAGLRSGARRESARASLPAR